MRTGGDLEGDVKVAHRAREKPVGRNEREWASFMEEYPLILGPVFTEDLVPPDFDIRGEDEFRQVALAMRLCSVTSFIGVPAIAVPTSIDGRKPRGVQVIGAPYREDVCFEAAAVLERHFGRFTPVTPLLSPA